MMSQLGDNLVELRFPNRPAKSNGWSKTVSGACGCAASWAGPAPASGHVYFDVKDDKAVLAAVMWKGNAQKLTMQPEQGLEVIVTGK